jgi:hypothetical protein
VRLTLRKAKGFRVHGRRHYLIQALQVIAQSFDEAWRDIAGIFDDDPSAVEKARTKLARDRQT